MSHDCQEQHDGWFIYLAKESKKCMPIQGACDLFSDCDNHCNKGGLCCKMLYFCLKTVN